jgi:hypothetical protein
MFIQTQWGEWSNEDGALRERWAGGRCRAQRPSPRQAGAAMPSGGPVTSGGAVGSGGAGLGGVDGGCGCRIKASGGNDAGSTSARIALLVAALVVYARKRHAGGRSQRSSNLA